MRSVILALRVFGRDLRGVRDVVVRAEHDHTVAGLCAALADHLGVGVPGLISQGAGRTVPRHRRDDSRSRVGGGGADRKRRRCQHHGWPYRAQGPTLLPRRPSRH